MNNTKRVWFDLLFYIAIPYLIWNQGKDIIGDYYAILLSTAPAFVYTIYTFIKDRQFNVTGLFIVITPLARTIIDLISGNGDDAKQSSILHDWTGCSCSVYHCDKKANWFVLFCRYGVLNGL